jgi:hypothetical protein
MDRVQSALVYLGRAVLGVLLAALLSVIGIGIAWGMFVFWGAVSHVTLLILFMTGAGVGAGLGGFAAWLRIDQAPPASMLVVVLMVLMLTGIGGAWVGFQFGASREVPCCVGPAIGPITYMVLGATIVANVVALAMGLIREIGLRRDWPGFRVGGPRSAAGASGEAGLP